MEKPTTQSVLVVDDDPAIRDIYATALKDAGYTTYTAGDGNEGLKTALEHHPSVIILDLMMPKMDGRAMLKELKADERVKDIPVLVFSALITELEREETLAAGARDYIEKSDVESPDQLIAKIKAIL
jgi:two-component system, OmpR family, alkaline phosphatase synthesis response regulator PhoP